MDNHGDALNLADEDIVKNTQFSPEECHGSQVQPTVEVCKISHLVT